MRAVTGLLGSSLVSSPPPSTKEPFSGIMQAVSSELSSFLAWFSLLVAFFGDILLCNFWMSVLICKFLLFFLVPSLSWFGSEISLLMLLLARSFSFGACFYLLSALSRTFMNVRLVWLTGLFTKLLGFLLWWEKLFLNAWDWAPR